MKGDLFQDLMRFSASKKSLGERIRYSLLSIIFYYSLSKTAKGKSKAAVSESAAGDDIYPLF